MTACVAGVVAVMWQTTCGVVDALGHERERRRRVVARLHLEPGPIDRAAVEPRRRAGLEPPERKAVAGERLRQAERRLFADAARRDLFVADMDQAVEEGAGRQHDPPRRNAPAVAQHEPADMPAGIEQQILGRPLDDVEIRRFGQQFGDGAAIELAVGLRARPAHRRALAAVEDAELDPGAVDRPAHDAVERIDLAHQMPLAEPADRRVARHLPNRRPLVRQQQRARPDPSRRRRRLAPGMPAADHDDVIRRESLVHGRECMERARDCRGFT